MGNRTSLAYDSTGSLESRTDANGQTTTYSRDGLDRPLSASYPDGTGVQATYDAVGNLLSATDETGTTSYGYDARNRRVQETLPGDKGTLKREYDGAGRRTALEDPDGRRTAYSYDAADRLTGVTGPEGGATGYAYDDDDDRPTEVSYPNGAGESLAYYPLGRVSSAEATGAGGSVLSKLTYGYDGNSNPTSISDQDGKESAFSYDALDRITEEAHPQKTLSYAYDAAGNRKSMTEGNATTSYAYDSAERMSGAGSDAFTYDKNGNMTSRTSGSTTTSYAYDPKDRLVRAGEKTYRRDARGRVVSSTEGGSTTDYLFDGARVIQEKTGRSAATRYLRGLGGRLISQRSGTGGAPSYYHHDPIGSVVGLSDNTGVLTDSYSYDAFGNELSKTGSSTQPYRYLGNRYEPSTGLYDSHARHYSPSTGRFLSKDPVRGSKGKPQTLNPYPCSVNNPLRYPDPSGLYPEEDPEAEYGETLTGDPYPEELTAEEEGEQYAAEEEVNDPTLTGWEQGEEYPTTGDCPEVPEAPSDADLDENIQAAEDHAAPAPFPTGSENDDWFYDQVDTGGPWDYKQEAQYEGQYQDFGNFNYGATGAAMGYWDQVLYRAAGYKQEPEAYDPSFGHWWGGYPYGDDPEDNEQIRLGIGYYENGCGDF